MNKKGFTLIELLAVIVILAIIALIAVPIILNIIGNAKEQSNLRSAELYLDAAKKAVARYQVNNSNADFSGTITCSISPDSIKCTGIGMIKVEVNGTKPTGGTIVLKDGKVPYGTVAFWSYVASDQINYFDYGYWTNGSYDYSLNEVFIDKQCTGDSCDWYDDIKYPVYVYGISNSNNGATTTLTNHVTNYVNNLNSSLATSATGRLITFEELLALGCDRNNRFCSSAPSWVYQTSYWSGSAGNNDRVWGVDSYGNFNSSYFDNDSSYGVRPVIEISKSVIK